MQKEGRRLDQTRILDVGCGVGKIHAHLRGKAAAIAGVDVSGASLEVARESYPEIDYKTYDGSRLPYPDNSFDLSMAICVFHHVPPGEWAELSREMMRVVRPGGLTLVIEHNPYNPVTRRIVNSCPLDRDAVLISPAKIRKFFCAAGGSDVLTRTILSVPPKTAWLKWIDSALGCMPFGAQYYLLAEKSAPNIS